MTYAPKVAVDSDDEEFNPFAVYVGQVWLGFIKNTPLQYLPSTLDESAVDSAVRPIFVDVSDGHF